MARRRRSLVAVLVLLLVLGALVVVVVQSRRTPEKPSLRLVQRAVLLSSAIKMQNNSLRYLHSTWFDSTYHYRTVPVSSISGANTAENPNTIEVLAPSGGFPDAADAEPAVRSQASALYATAIALNNNTYDATQVGVSRTEALRRVVAWTNALAISYHRDGWAEGWQTPLWVYYLSYGAHQEWDALPPVTQNLIDAAVASEANHLLTLPPPYYKNAKGEVLYKGDSKSEEDAWDGAFLLTAAREYPGNPNAKRWETQAKAYMLVAFASPDQVGHDRRILGSNLNANGTVTNHGKINPDYMFSAAEMMVKCDLASAEAHAPVPAECHNNLALVWRGLTATKFEPGTTYKEPGGTIYRWDKNNKPTANIYYPQGYDWSPRRRFNAAEMDVEYWSLFDDATAFGFATKHLAYTLALQAQHKDGMTFSKNETRFAEEEQFVAATGAEIVSRLEYVH